MDALQPKSTLNVPASVPVTGWVPEESAATIRRPRSAVLVSAASYLFAAAIAYIGKQPTLDNGIIWIDEASYVVEAQRLDSLYAFIYSAQYVTETKMQLGLVPYMLALAIDQQNAVFWVHILGLLATVASACLLVSIANLLFRSPVPGLIAAASAALWFNNGEQTAGTVLEVFQVPLLLLSCWFFVKALQDTGKKLSTRSWYLFWAGCFTGLATLVKPPGIALAPVMGLFLLLSFLGEESKVVRRITSQVIALVAGVIFPVALFLLPYLFDTQALAALKFNLIDITTGYASQGPGLSLADRIRELYSLLGIGRQMLLVPMAQWSLWIFFKDGAERWQKEGFYELFFLMSGGAMLVAYASGQGKLHYLIPVIPLLMLPVGSRLVAMFKRLGGPVPMIILAQILFIGTLLLERNTIEYYRHISADKGISYLSMLGGLDIQGTVQYIQSHSGPQDYVWIYYNAPELYWMSGRKPATDEPVGTWLIDYYNDFWFNRTYDQLVTDKPAVIVGLLTTRFPRPVPPVTEVPRIKDLIAESYNCDTSAIPNTILCTRK